MHPAAPAPSRVCLEEATPEPFQHSAGLYIGVRTKCLSLCMAYTAGACAGETGGSNDAASACECRHMWWQCSRRKRVRRRKSWRRRAAYSCRRSWSQRPQRAACTAACWRGISSCRCASVGAAAPAAPLPLALAAMDSGAGLGRALAMWASSVQVAVVCGCACTC